MKPYLREGQVESSQPKIGDRVELFRPLYKAYYPGNITSYDSAEGKYMVQYDDGDSENLNLATEKWRPMPKIAKFSTTFENL